MGVTRWVLARETAAYGLGGFIGKAVAVATLPILTRLLGPADYGLVDVVATCGSALTVILLLGSDTAATKLALEEATEHGRARILRGWVTWITLLGGLAAVAILVGVAVLSTAGAMAADAATVVALLAAIVPLGLLNFTLLTVLRIYRRSGTFAAITGGELVVNGFLAVLGAGAFGLGPAGVVGAWALSLGLGVAIGLVHLRGILGWSVDKETVRQILGFGLRLVPGIAALWIGEVVNRGVLLVAAGTSEVGLLSAAVRIASVVALVWSGVLLAWQPRAFSRQGPRDRDDLGRESSAIAILVALVVILVSIGGPELAVVLAGDEFKRAGSMVGFLAVAAFAAGLTQLLGVSSAMAQRPLDVSTAVIGGVVVSVALCALLAPTLGGRGAAVGMAAGQILSSLLLFRRTKNGPIPFGSAAVVGALVATATCSILVSFAGLGTGARVPIGVACSVPLAVLAWRRYSVSGQTRPADRE